MPFMREIILYKGLTIFKNNGYNIYIKTIMKTNVKVVSW